MSEWLARRPVRLARYRESEPEYWTKASLEEEGNASAGLPPDAAKCSVKTRGSCSLAATMTAQRPIDSAAPVPCTKGSLWGRRSVAAAARERGI